MEMGDRNERHKRRFTQILFQEAPSISGDAKEESTASASYATEGVRLKKKKKRRRSIRSSTTGQSKTSAQRLVIKEESPWETYNANMRVRLDMWLAKAVRRDGTNDGVVAIRTFSKTSTDQILQRYQMLDHRSLVNAFEIFLTDGADKHVHVVSEYLPFCLDHVVASGRRPTDGQLASIMAQVNPMDCLSHFLLVTDEKQIFDALSYLHSKGLRHGSLRSTSILVTFEGVVKIGIACFIPGIRDLC